MENNRYKRLLNNTLIFAAGTFLSKALVYLMTGYYTTVLTTAESDAASLIQQISNLIMPIAAVGIYDAMMRFTIDAGDRKREVFSSSVSVILLGGAVFILLSPLLLFLNYLKGWQTAYSLLIVFFVLCANYQISVSYYIRSLGKTRLYALQGIVNTVLVVALNLLFLGVFRLGATGYILSVTLANLAVAVWLTLQEKLYLDFDRSSVKLPMIKELLKYGLPLIPTGLLWTLTNLTDNFIVRSQVSIEANGMLVFAYKIPTVLTILTTVFIEAWQLSSINDAKEGSDRSGFFRDVFRSYSSLIFLAASGLILIIRPLAQFFLRGDYYEAWVWMPTLIIATVFSAFSTFMSTVFMVSKKTLPDFLTALCGASVNIVLSLLLAKPLGVQGVCIATIVCYIVLFVLRYLGSKKYMDFKIFPLRLTVNALLVSVQAILQITDLTGDFRIAVQIILFLACLAFNFSPLFAFLKAFLSSLKRKKV